MSSRGRGKRGKRGKRRAGRRAKRKSSSRRGRVFLARPVFVVLVAAATEAYRRECYGALLGHRRRGLVYGRAAVAYQSARRAIKSVDLAERRRRVIRRVLRAFPRHEYLGEFHSHPGYGRESGKVFIGDGDMYGTRPGECEMVVAVRRARAWRSWRHCADGTLSGTAGGFFLKIGAYLVERAPSGGVRPRVAGIRCPYAVTTASSRRLLEQNANSPGP